VRRCLEATDTCEPRIQACVQAPQSAFNVLFLGLGAVALLVGAIGVANIMVIAVLERWSEIGLRRALGATKGHIRVQFLAEAILLTLTGGIAGIAADAAAVAVYAHARGWATVIPHWPGQADSPPPSSSAPPPGSCPPCAPPASHPPKPSGRYEPPRSETVTHDEEEREKSRSVPGRADTVRRVCQLKLTDPLGLVTRFLP
jgi:hypothetical protein